MCDNRALGWIQRMLLTEQQLRPTAASLVASITASDKDRRESTVSAGYAASRQMINFLTRSMSSRMMAVAENTGINLICC